MPLQHVIEFKKKKKNRLKQPSVCVCVSDMEEKLQLDLRIRDLTCENDTDCSGQETVKCDRGKLRQRALKKQRKEGHKKSAWNISRSGNSL